MGLITHQYEFTAAIPPIRLFKAIVTDYQNVMPKVLPSLIKNIENIKGDGSKPGDVQRLVFFQEDRPDKVKQIDVVDQDNLVYAYTLLEGDFKGNLSDKIEKIVYEYKLETLLDGGSTLIKNNMMYHVEDDQFEIKKERFDDVKQKASALFSLIESYLKQHPDFYN